MQIKITALQPLHISTTDQYASSQGQKSKQNHSASHVAGIYFLFMQNFSIIAICNARNNLPLNTLMLEQTMYTFHTVQYFMLNDFMFKCLPQSTYCKNSKIHKKAQHIYIFILQKAHNTWLLSLLYLTWNLFSSDSIFSFLLARVALVNRLEEGT